MGQHTPPDDDQDSVPESVSVEGRSPNGTSPDTGMQEISHPHGATFYGDRSPSRDNEIGRPNSLRPHVPDVRERSFNDRRGTRPTQRARRVPEHIELIGEYNTIENRRLLLLIWAMVLTSIVVLATVVGLIAPGGCAWVIGGLLAAAAAAASVNYTYKSTGSTPGTDEPKDSGTQS